MTPIEECVHSLSMSEGLLTSTSVTSAKNLLSIDTLVSFLKCQYGGDSYNFNVEVDIVWSKALHSIKNQAAC
jgi:hypothetical protein